MPEAVWKKRRRLMPRRLAMCAPISFTRASNSRCLAVCGAGMNSSLDTDCTGIGDGNRDSAEDTRSISSGLSQLMRSPSRRGFELLVFFPANLLRTLREVQCAPGRAKEDYS